MQGAHLSGGGRLTLWQLQLAGAQEIRPLDPVLGPQLLAEVEDQEPTHASHLELQD